jgi:hypothetical protein
MACRGRQILITCAREVRSYDRTNWHTDGLGDFYIDLADTAKAAGDSESPCPQDPL